MKCLIRLFEWLTIALPLIALAACGERAVVPKTPGMTKVAIKGYIFKSSEGKTRLVLAAKSFKHSTTLRLPGTGYVFVYASPKRSRIGDLLRDPSIVYDLGNDKWTVIYDTNLLAAESQSALPSSMMISIITDDDKTQTPVIVDLLPLRPPKEINGTNGKSVGKCF